MEALSHRSRPTSSKFKSDRKVMGNIGRAIMKGTKFDLEKVSKGSENKHGNTSRISRSVFDDNSNAGGKSHRAKSNGFNKY